MHGGLKSDEYPAILQRGETVIPRDQRASDSRVVNNINIVNNSGAEVKTEEKPNSNGGVDLEVMIGNIAAKQLSTRGTYANKAIRQNYGMRERLIQR